MAKKPTMRKSATTKERTTGTPSNNVAKRAAAQNKKNMASYKK